MPRSSPLFTTASLVWFCYCIASLCLIKESLALQPHQGRARSSLHNFDNNAGSSGGRRSSKARSSRVAPLIPTSSSSSPPTFSVRVNYARSQSENDSAPTTGGCIVPLTQNEFDEFRENLARPGALSVTSANGTTRQQQQQQQQQQQKEQPREKNPRPDDAFTITQSKQPPITNGPQKLSKRNESLVAVACVLAANAGFMNGVGLSAIVGQVQGVSGVTSAFTGAGVAASAVGVGAMATVLLTPLSYMLGSLTNGLWNPGGVFVVVVKMDSDDEDDDDQSSSSSLRTGPLLLSASMIMLGNGLLSDENVHSTLACLVCWTFAMGLQNSWSSLLLKGNVLRSAHFSGITSDIGTILGQTWRGNTEHSWKLPIFAKLTASFWTGGVVSSAMGLQLGVSSSTFACMSTCLYLGLWSHLSCAILPGIEATTPSFETQAIPPRTPTATK
jgi:uncharacterized membrane protein YoaK (UPF0700 family)